MVAIYLVGMADICLVAIVFPPRRTGHKKRPDFAAVRLGLFPGMFDLFIAEGTKGHREEAAKDEESAG